MVKFTRFTIRGAKFLLIRENKNSYDVAFSRYPLWGAAIKHFRNVNHINIGNDVLSPERTLISKVKEDELHYSIRLPLKEEKPLCVELETVEESGMRVINIELEDQY